MRTTVIMICVFAVASAKGMAAHSSREECEEVKQKIRRIEAKMRQGYSAREGVRLEDRLRELREKRSKLCR